jgi:hypothetical protein
MGRPRHEKALTVIVVVLGGSIVPAVASLRSNGTSEDPTAVAKEFGVQPPAWRIRPAKPLRDYRFAVSDRGDGAPCVSYRFPDRGGASCLVAVGERGGWALEARLQTSGKNVFVYGAAVAATHAIRLGRLRRRIRTIVVRPALERFSVRFVVARVPRSALKVHPNDIVALDAKGRLLGRQHYNDGHDGFGRFDGIWERHLREKHRSP